MAKLLLLFAHPLLEKSRVHTRLVQTVRQIPGITFHDLYEAYPDFDIDAEEEKLLLLEHDIIILQHPIYWYSSPPLVKQWQDLVLQYGWAYGKGGTALTGKQLMQVVSAGGPATAYSSEGRNRYSIRQYLIPFEQSFRLCHMEYLAPVIIHGTHRLSVNDIDMAASKYGEFLEAMKNDVLTSEQLQSYSYFDLLTEPLPVNIMRHE